MIADTLRRAHLVDGVPWSSMAVLVRSAVRQVPVLQRALTSGRASRSRWPGMSCRWPPSPAPGRCCADRLRARPGTLDEEAAAELLTGPLGGTDALGLRRLRRVLRPRRRRPGSRPRPSRWPRRCVIRASWSQAGPLARPPTRPRRSGGRAGAGPGRAPAVAAARQVAALLALAREAARTARRTTCCGRSGQRPGWPRSWQAASAAGGSRGAAADADLDAVMALFDAAARFTGAAAARLDPAVPGQPVRPGDRRRHAGRARAAAATRSPC